MGYVSTKAVLVLAVFLGSVFLPVQACAQQAGHVEARLVAQDAFIRPGTPFLVAARFQMDQDWHIYWKNPGDTGLPTTLAWDLPKGYSVSDTMWPAPQRFISQGQVSYGYEHEVFLLARITPPADQAVLQEVTLRAHVTWLACRIECTPGKADLEIRLPMRSGPPAPDPRWAASFRDAGRLVPSSIPGVTLTVERSQGRILLHVHGLTIDSAGRPWFAPAEAGLLADGAPQTARVSASSLTIDLQPSKQASAKRIRGVLVLQGPTAVRGVEVDASVTGPKTAEPGSTAAGLLVAMALAFLGGLILNLMPCVLPVISLKVLSFVKNSREGAGSSLRHGLFFGAGVLVSFWGIAAILVALRAGGQLLGWGFQFQSPAVVTVTAALFFLIGLSLLDVFELRLPVRISASSSQGGTGSFLSGLLATAVATPCTAPFMGGALGYALTQPPAASFGVFTALALGLAAPYVVLSALPGLITRIPRPGPWMVTLRQILAFPMLGAVIWMMYVLETLAGFPALMTLLSALLLAGLGAWIFGRWGGLEKSLRSRVISSALAVVLIVGATAFSAVRSATAPAPSSDPVAAGPWETWSPERVSQLQAAGTPVFVDFSAKWCLTCQVNETVALGNPDVLRAFKEKGVATLRADWTDRNDTIARALAGLGRAGVPVYALYPRGSTQPVLLPELLTPGVVLDALEKIR